MSEDRACAQPSEESDRSAAARSRESGLRLIRRRDHSRPLQRHGLTAMKNTVASLSRLASIPTRAKRFDTSQ